MTELYRTLLEGMKALVDPKEPVITGLANASALLYQQLPDLNWAGFYMVRGHELALGPFQGKPACTRIEIGRGVCGSAWKEDQVLRVMDVHAFPGHIACDSASASEIVLPIHQGGKVAAVLDLDSPQPGRFLPEDEEGLRSIAKLSGREAFFISAICLRPEFGSAYRDYGFRCGRNQCAEGDHEAASQGEMRLLWRF